MKTNEVVATALATTSYGTVFLSMYGGAAAPYWLVVGEAMRAAGATDGIVSEVVDHDPPHPSLLNFLARVGTGRRTGP